MVSVRPGAPSSGTAEGPGPACPEDRGDKCLVPGTGPVPCAGWLTHAPLWSWPLGDGQGESCQSAPPPEPSVPTQVSLALLAIKAGWGDHFSYQPHLEMKLVPDGPPGEVGRCRAPAEATSQSLSGAHSSDPGCAASLPTESPPGLSAVNG